MPRPDRPVESRRRADPVTRSRLYATARADFLGKHRGRKTTERLNAVYGTEESRLHPRLRRLQGRSLGEPSW